MQPFKITDQEPINFNGNVHVAAAYIKAEGKFLFMQLSSAKEEASKWGVPAGKCERDETPIEGLRRELFEETSIRLNDQETVFSAGTLYITKPHISYSYHLFGIFLPSIPNVQISDEHIAYQWVKEHEVHQLDLLTAAKEAFDYFIYESAD
ncbi:MAG: NUDIX hydrolase [Parachlamydiaceae bacterium]